MSNQINYFYFEQQSSIRMHLINEEPWFVAVDVCSVLGIANSRDALSKLDEDERGVALTDTLSGRQKMAIINESGLYILILRCRDAVKPGTVPHRFRKWITNDVLPSIRKTGSYHQQEKNHHISTAEPLSSTDIKNLKYLIIQMTNCFKFQRSWSNAVWYALRRATGVSSPEPFSVDDLPILTEECRRIIEITGLLSEHFRHCEKETIRRIVKNREDCDIVIRELQREWQNSGISTSALRQLELHEQRALGKFEGRIAI